MKKEKEKKERHFNYREQEIQRQDQKCSVTNVGKFVVDMKSYPHFYKQQWRFLPS